MFPWRIRTPSEQVAEYLREKILSRQYQNVMPGKAALAKDLGIDPKTITLAMKLLEQEKLLVPQGPGKPRLIKLPDGNQPVKLKLMILLYEDKDIENRHILKTRHQLTKLGYQIDYCHRTLLDMEMDTQKIARLLKRTPADAWLVEGGSKIVLEWFSRQPIPCFALFGRSPLLKIAAAGVMTPDAYRDIVRRLFALGHRRIVFLCREDGRLPVRSLTAEAFLDELEIHGIKTSDYHLPNWEDSAAGLQSCLDSLFKVTPPTAIVSEMPVIYLPVQQHLMKNGMRIPEDVSLICTEHDPNLSWMYPRVTHYDWDHQPISRHILRWARNIALGKEYYKQKYVDCEFVDGDTIGSCP